MLVLVLSQLGGGCWDFVVVGGGVCWFSWCYKDPSQRNRLYSVSTPFSVVVRRQCFIAHDLTAQRAERYAYEHMN